MLPIVFFFLLILLFFFSFILMQIKDFCKIIFLFMQTLKLNVLSYFVYVYVL